MFLYSAAAAALVGAVSAGTGAWIDLFSPPYTECPTIMIGMSCIDKGNCYVAGGSNGVGFDVFRFNGQPNAPFVGELMPSKPMMIMGMAAGGTVEDPKAVSLGVGFGNGVQYLKNATTFEPSAVKGEFLIAGQWITMSKDGTKALGMDRAGQAALFSTDSGVTFNTKHINTARPSGPNSPANCTLLQYSSIADDLTWYVTGASWPESSASAKRSVGAGSGGSSSSSGPNPRADCTGFAGLIAKTTDGGNTWKTLLSDAGNYEITFISCTSAVHCLAVGGSPATGALIFQTKDGETFKQVLQVPTSKVAEYSFEAVEFVPGSVTDAWVAGSNAATNQAIFYRTTDGGDNWVEFSHGQPNIATITDLSFTADGTGYATALTAFRTGTILKFEPKGTPQKFFSEVQCPFKGCTALCHQSDFPEGVCIPAEGGSAIAQCGQTELTQKMYNTTSCVGAYTTNSMPLNKCLKDTQGSYFTIKC